MNSRLQALRMSTDDDVANVLAAVKAGNDIRVLPDGAALTATTPVPAYHKVALRDIAEGAHVIRNGIAIGAASRPIPAGAHVHVHNLVSLRAGRPGDSRPD